MPSIPKLNKETKFSTGLLKFNEDTLNNILKRSTAGVPLPIAAPACGMSYTRLKEIMRQGRLDLAHDLDTMHSRFVVRLNNLNADQIEARLSNIENDQKGHHGCEWSLERKFWKHFSGRAAELELAEELEDLRAEIELNKKQNKSEGDEYGKEKGK